MIDENNEACSICLYPLWGENSGLGVQNIYIRHSKSGNSYEHFDHEISIHDPDSTRTSAKKGCPGCYILISVWDRTYIEDADEFLLDFLRDETESYISTTADEESKKFDLFTVPGKPNFDAVRVASFIPRTTILEENLNQVMTWINSCQEDHAPCKQICDYLPPRLLDLQSLGPDIVRLVDSEKLQESLSGPPRYACLSHCWGKTRSKYLTCRDRLEENKKSIPVDLLPRTFKDAIAIAKALSINYLWIDSLCIIQDDKGDWEKYVSEMAKIYRSSFITLAAGASADDDGGFFREAESEYVDVHTFELNFQDTVYEFHLRHAIRHIDAKDERISKDRLPLMTRGWTLQERLLSNRYLLFGAQEVMWECPQEVACSCSIGNSAFCAGSCFINCDSTRLDFTRWNMQIKKFTQAWHLVVQNYSTRMLSFRGDKLPALAGMSQRFKEIMAGEYRFGVWKNTIALDLMWKTCSDTPIEFGRPLNLPSWTWASAAECHILFFRVQQEHIVTVLSFPADKSMPDGKQPLTIRGSLVTFTALEVVPFKSWQLSQGYYPLFFHCKMLFENTPKDSFKPNEECGDIGYFSADYRFWTSEEDRKEKFKNLVMLIVGTQGAHSPIDGLVWINGIILRPIEGDIKQEHPEYERVGYLTYGSVQMLRGESNFESDLEDVEDDYKDSEGNLICLETHWETGIEPTIFNIV
ncbi:HET-domain-containing protein [Corynespora cassiicola Philippines]|uniref:HET-domain-containing protein n=1 Tax=Corynespora cassiicola Philippines TaxID=1448308 RepID=A0A2T2N3V7_CORCC|nr:HET-domain-containing protein [Corynespora cassiicola Philippines]